jgi:hypothetical protein
MKLVHLVLNHFHIHWSSIPLCFLWIWVVIFISSDNHIGSSGAESLFHSLIFNSTLLSLDLRCVFIIFISSGNKIGPFKHKIRRNETCKIEL